MKSGPISVSTKEVPVAVPMYPYMAPAGVAWLNVGFALYTRYMTEFSTALHESELNTPVFEFSCSRGNRPGAMEGIRRADRR